MRLNERSDADKIYGNASSKEIEDFTSKLKFSLGGRRENKKDIINLLDVNVDFEIAARSIDRDIAEANRKIEEKNSQIDSLDAEIKKLYESKIKILNKDPSFDPSPSSYRDGTFRITLNRKACDDAISKDNLLALDFQKIGAERARQAAELRAELHHVEVDNAKRKAKKNIYMATFYVMALLAGAYLFTNGHYSYFVAGLISVIVIAAKLDE